MGVHLTGLGATDHLLRGPVLHALRLQKSLTVIHLHRGTTATDGHIDAELRAQVDDATERGIDAKSVQGAGDTGTEAAGVLTLRQALPTLSGGVTRILEIAYTDVLSAQLLLDASVVAAVVSAGPPVTLDKYGFYLSDPLGVVRRYLDIITAAGVIPDVLEK